MISMGGRSRAQGTRRVARVTFLFLALFIVSGLALPITAVLGQESAQPDPSEIQIVSEKVDSKFPDNVTFNIAAVGPDPIDEVRVFLKPLGTERSTYGYLDIVPGREVDGEYVMDTGIGPNHRPPGTVIRYSYEIRDMAGRVLQTEDREYLYLDESLEWKFVASDDGFITVYYYGDFVEKRAQTVLEATQQTVEEMGRVLDVALEEPIKVVAYSNYRDMARALPFRSQAVREDLRTDGQAYPVERVVLVLASDTTVTGIASHEITHILVADAAGQGYSRVPVWLNEGLAEFGNVDKTPHYDWALNYAVFTRRLKPLWYQQEFTGDPDDILITYGHGKSVVSYLIDRYGEGKMAELMKAFHTSSSVDEALNMTYGFDQYGLDTEWRLAVGLEPLPSPAELERELSAAGDSQPNPQAEDAPGGVDNEATPGPTPRTEPTPVSDAGDASERPVASDNGTSPRSARSCNGPSEGAASIPADIALLALMGGTFLALNARWGLGKSRLLRRLRRIRRPRARSPDPSRPP